MHRRTAFAVLLALVCGAGAAESQTVLTVDRVLDLVEQQNPQVLLARAQVLEAQGLLTTARARLATNPEVDAFLGSRPTGTGRSAEIELSVLQMADDVAKLPVALRLSQRTLRIIKQNIALSLVNKGVFVVLAVGGWATLGMAVASDMGASLVVILNGLRALRTDR